MASTQNLLDEPSFQQAADIRRRRDNAEKWEELKTYMYNPQDGTILQQSRRHWGLFELSYYCSKFQYKYLLLFIYCIHKSCFKTVTQQIFFLGILSVTTVAFYTAFYLALMALFIVTMALFMVDLDDISPTVQHMDSPMKLNPGTLPHC